MDDLGIEVLIGLLMAIELQADGPSFTTKVAFIPKADGGLRPIALLAAVVRVHGRLRRPTMQQWEKGPGRPYLYAQGAHVTERCGRSRRGIRAGLASVPCADSHQVRFSALAGQAADLSAPCAEGAAPRRVLRAGVAGLPGGARWRRVRRGLHEAHVVAAARRDGRA
eukprot:6132901-Pyramimonas_sp.AAC.1